jgi:predicted HTH domain antitoxin
MKIILEFSEDELCELKQLLSNYANGLEKQNSTSILYEIFKMGLHEFKKKKAIQLYSEGKITLSQASEMSGFPLCDLLEYLLRMRIPILVYTTDLRELVIECARMRAEYYRLIEEMAKE